MLAGTPVERAYRAVLEGALVRPLARAGVTPDHLTWAGLAVAGLAGLVAPWRPEAAGFLVLLGGLLDTLDGSLARATGCVTRRGAFLDSTLDRYAEFLVIAGVWGRCVRTGWELAGGVSALLAVQGSLMVSYARARAEGLGHPLRGGVFERPERLLVLAAGLLATPTEEWLGVPPGSAGVVTLAVVAVGANATAVGRIVRARRVLAGSAGGPDASGA